jgi:hypothetical protein
MKKAINYLWNEDSVSAFNKMKETPVSAPILAFPCFDKPFLVYADDPNVGIGSKLNQNINTDERLTANGNRTINTPEQH